MNKRSRDPMLPKPALSTRLWLAWQMLRNRFVSVSYESKSGITMVTVSREDYNRRFKI